MPLYGSSHDPVDVGLLSEAGAPIPGPIPGDLPDLSTISDPPTQAEMIALRDALRQTAEQVNVLLTALRRKKPR